MWVYVIFEQGWIALLLLALVVVLVLIQLGKQAWRGDPVSLVFLAAFMSGLTVSITDSILDAPRIALLFFLLLFASLLHTAGGAYPDVQAPNKKSKTH